MTHLYELWNSFLKIWPVHRVKNMSLNEYTNLNRENSFTYWLETLTEDLGSIWGGSSFKFGIYTRREHEEKESKRGLTYEDEYAWYTKYGSTKEDVFKTVKKNIIAVIDAVQNEELHRIDNINLGEAYKWKIAFLYQNRKKPIVLNIFTADTLRTAAPDYSSDKISELHTYLLKNKNELDLISYGEKLWEEFSSHFNFWKVSHGKGKHLFSTIERKAAIENKTIIVHKNTNNGKENNFKTKMKKGDYVYLCNGNDQGIVLLGRVLTDAKTSNKDDGCWYERSIEVIKKLDKPKHYTGLNKKWAPNHQSTCVKVKPHELKLFQREILIPYFSLSVAEIYHIDSSRVIEDVFNHVDDSEQSPDIKSFEFINNLPPVNPPVNPPENDRKSKGKKGKVDYVKKTKKAILTGDKGEKLVIKAEKERLEKAGFVDLAEKVEQISLKDDSLGYDVLSFEADESEIRRHIEVKTTTYEDLGQGFYLTKNELDKSNELENYWLYIVLDINSSNPKIFREKEPFKSDGYVLKESQYRVYKK